MFENRKVGGVSADGAIWDTIATWLPFGAVFTRVFCGDDSRPGAEQQLLTKGDNNVVDDRGLYAPGQLYLKRSDLLGRARGYVVGAAFPYVLLWIETRVYDSQGCAIRWHGNHHHERLPVVQVRVVGWYGFVCAHVTRVGRTLVCISRNQMK
jgi:hypothetical protein